MYNAKKLLVSSLWIIVGTGGAGLLVHLHVNQENTPGKYFDGKMGSSGGTILVGASCNLIFGFIDNAGLFFGCDLLDEIFEKLPNGDDCNVCAG